MLYPPIAESNLPPSIVDSILFSVVGSKSAASEDHVIPQGVSPGYFSTLGIPLLEGRLWSETEIAHASRVALINAATRRRLLPKLQPYREDGRSQ